MQPRHISRTARATVKRRVRSILSSIRRIALAIAIVLSYLGLLPEPVHRFLPRLQRKLRADWLVDWHRRAEVAREQPKYVLPTPARNLPARIIYLRRSKERNRLTFDSAKHEGLSMIPFPAIDGIDPLDVDMVRRFAGPKKKRRLEATVSIERSRLVHVYEAYKSFGRIEDKRMLRSIHERLQFGCYMSHIYLWREMLLHRLPLLIILEDDVKLVSGFLERLERTLNTLPRDWGILYLNGCYRFLGPQLDAGLFLSRGGLCTCGYVISPLAARKLLRQPARKSEKMIDHMLNDEVLAGTISAFHVEPPLVHVVAGLNSTLAYY